jgi:predicted amidohydrolase YtcJ
MIVLDKNPLEIKAEELPKLKVLYTVVNGIVRGVNC